MSTWSTVLDPNPDSYTKDNIQLLEAIQRRAARFLCNKCVQQTRERYKYDTGPGLALAGTETSRIPPNIVPPDIPQGSRHERACTDGTQSQSLTQRK